MRLYLVHPVALIKCGQQVLLSAFGRAVQHAIHGISPSHYLYQANALCRFNAFVHHLSARPRRGWRRSQHTTNVSGS